MENVNVLVGKTLASITPVEAGDEEIDFITTGGEKYRMYHRQDCCEHVRIEDIDGYLDDLVGVPILVAEEVSNRHNNPPNGESATWTFYKFATVKGYVTIRWIGESNGYYSEGVDFERVN